MRKATSFASLMQLLLVVLFLSTADMRLLAAEMVNVVNDLPVRSNVRPVLGRLVITGDKAISVNGNNVRSGATIMPGALIETPDGVGASLQLAPLGRLEVAPRTKLQLSFGNENIDVSVLTGCVILTTAVGTRGSVLTARGRNERIGPTAASSVEVCSEDAEQQFAINGDGLGTTAGTAGRWSNGKLLQTAKGLTPLFLVGATPFAIAGYYANYCDGRPPVASPCGCCCL
ncbi:MAG: hypothetical protein U0Y68_02405 [Blastocatellia bacterium]